MQEELQRRNYAETTTKAYIRVVADFASYFKKSPDQLGAEEIRQHQLHLSRDKKMQANSIGGSTAALRFFFLKTLGREHMAKDLPLPRRNSRLPEVLSREEVAELIGSACTLHGRALLMTLYSTGIRCAELQNLKVEDIDSQRMVIHIRQGKGRKDRDVLLSPVLLATLRQYWREAKPSAWLFPGMVRHQRDNNKRCSRKAIFHTCRTLGVRAGLKRSVCPHLIRHCFATHMLEAGVDLRTIQLLLGHTSLRSTSRYLHLSRQHMQSVVSPLDTLQLPATPDPEPKANP
jgi:integrase/recombinase XerD